MYISFFFSSSFSSLLSLFFSFFFLFFSSSLSLTFISSSRTLAHRSVTSIVSLLAYSSSGRALISEETLSVRFFTESPLFFFPLFLFSFFFSFFFFPFVFFPPPGVLFNLWYFFLPPLPFPASCRANWNYNSYLGVRSRPFKVNNQRYKLLPR